MAIAERDAAQHRLQDLVTLLQQSSPGSDHMKTLVQEADALGRAIAAFHLEGIRFRFYNLDRLVTHSPVPLPPEAAAIMADVRQHLEAAGFHTRSHDAR